MLKSCKYFYKAILFIICLAVLVLGLSSCGKPTESANTIRVGTIAGPETDLMEVAKTYAKKQFGLNIQIIAFSDYTSPNRNLSSGDLDANMFQTIAYYDAAVKAQHYKFAIVGKTFIYPMALYSKKIDSLAKLPEKAVIAIPNDPSNESRALLLLQAAKLITLKPLAANALSSYTPLDIKSNPKQLQIRPINAAQIPRSLDDVTLGAINTNYAVLANLFPKRNGLFVESKDSPYANIVVVRAVDKNNKKVKQLVAALHSKAVLEAAKRIFKDQAIPAWDVKK